MSTSGGTSRPSVRYLIVLFAALAAGLGMVAAFNFFVDPFGAYRPRATAGLEKFRGYEFRRLYVGELLRHDPPEVLLLGSSRTYVGADPRWPEWGGTAVNAGIPSATMEEIGAIADYAVAQGGVRRVYLFADFFSFNDAVHSHRDFDRARFSPRFNPVAYHFRNLLTADSLDQSMDVVRAWRGAPPIAPSVRGFKVRPEPRVRPDQRGDILASLNFYLKSSTAFPSFKSYAQSMETLRGIVRRCREGGIELTVVVLPVHALHLEVIRGAGVWDLFESWERDVAALLEEEGREAKAAPYAFWDFTTYRGAAAEAIPTARAPGPAMKFFRDEAHPMPLLVHSVAQRVGGRPVTDPADHGRFGELVTVSNVEAHLAEIRAERETYAATHRAETKWVANLAAAAADWIAKHPVPGGR